MLRMADHPIST